MLGEDPVVERPCRVWDVYEPPIRHGHCSDYHAEQALIYALDEPANARAVSTHSATRTPSPSELSACCFGFFATIAEYPELRYPVLGCQLVAVATSIHDPDYGIMLLLLRRLREDAGLRQVDLAALLGRPQSFVSKVEAGERRLDIIELRTICRHLGTTLPSFVRRLEDELRPPRPWCPVICLPVVR